MQLSRVSIIGVGDSGEAQLLRLQLEHLGLATCLNLVGKPSDFFDGFSFYGQVPDAVIIAAHGDDAGIVFPEMAAGVDELVLPDDRITPALIARELKSPPPLVISLACASGTTPFTKAFSSAGAKTYIAPVGDPDGRDVPLFVNLLFHAMTGMELPIHDALNKANAAIDSTSVFQIFQ